MPRKAFIADLAAVSQISIPGISNVVKGPEDGEIELIFTPSSNAEPIVVTILSSDVGEYPGPGNPYFLSTSSHTAPEAVNRALANHGEISLGMTIEQLLSSLATAFHQAYASSTDVDAAKIDKDGDTKMDEDEVYGSDNIDQDSDTEDDDVYYDPYANLSDDGFEATASHKMDPKSAVKINARLRKDLQALKQAGFKVGVLRGMAADSDTSVLSISIRVSKLGLSDEALHAWDMKPNQYAVLLIRYSLGYRTFDFVVEHGVSREIQGIEFRVGLCNRYKPTIAEGMAAFSEAKKGEAGRSDESVSNQDLAGFSSLFISSSLNEFMNTDFISIMKYRTKLGISWDGAKILFNAQQGTNPSDPPNVNQLPDEFFGDDTPKDKVLPAIAHADHLRENAVSSEYSFPLIAMQFYMRYLVRCPEFCLICHDKTTETFEALKPYVCSRGLCLFQYMQLGFGPSIEHEIITQPYVVDLLISFCYAAAVHGKLRSYPLGQHIFVPPRDTVDLARQLTIPPTARPHINFESPMLVEQVVDTPPRFWNVKFDALKHEVLIDDPKAVRGDFMATDWVVINFLDGEPIHYRITNTSIFPTIQLSETGISRASPPRVPGDVHGERAAMVTQTPATTPPASYVVSAQISKYERNFDELSTADKATSIAMLLETLPKVTEMRDYLTQECSVKEPRLSNWLERITQPALTLLRWIISSNRSIICQVNSAPGQEAEDALNAGVRLGDKVTGMDNMVQFRFAQGAPDKEQRFVDSLIKMKDSLNQTHPTIFAWHGSAISNWHSIIRAGLDYAQILNGRVFGHGCYFSQDFNTSAGYCSIGGQGLVWPGSVLQISTAMAMTEIVNAPDEFISKTPHLVVQHVDWIQCRYLFVNKGPSAAGAGYLSNAPESSIAATASITYIDQDPQYQIKNRLGEVVRIPTHAIASRKAMGIVTPRKGSTCSQPPKKKRKAPFFRSHAEKEKDLPAIPQDEYDTDVTDTDDQDFFTHGEEHTEPGLVSNGKRKDLLDFTTTSPVMKTDFVAGTLAPSSLHLMADPSYATSSASMQLSRALKVALKTQKETPPHELGWAIDDRFTENLYQWIVELHSFEAKLPLAQDMKKAGVTSVVLEIRFGKNFPISPPFVRIIRPRFLPFMSGGGGHVTAGGALCMELLTNSGWSAVNSIESVLMQVRLAMSSLDPRPARLHTTEKNIQSDYGVGEAMEAFIRACTTHGWEIPSDFTELKASASASSELGISSLG